MDVLHNSPDIISLNKYPEVQNYLNVIVDQTLNQHYTDIMGEASFFLKTQLADIKMKLSQIVLHLI